MKAQAQKTAIEIEKAVDAVVEDGLLLYPNLKFASLIELLVEQTEPALRSDHSRALLLLDYSWRARRIQVARRKREAEKQITFAFPALRDLVLQLPARLRDGSLHVTAYREELKTLNMQGRDRLKTNKRRATLQAVIDLFPKSPKKRRISLAEVDAIKAKKAGFV